MDIKTRVLETYDALHAMPEIGFQEEKTSAYLAEKLESFGFTVKRGLGGTGVLGELKGVAPGPVVGLRADMDALGHEVDGKLVAIHSCGHDAHSTMVLAAAEALAKKGIARGTLKILFQPAEELLFGARRMIADGVADDLEMLFGIHLRPGQEARAPGCAGAEAPLRPGLFALSLCPDGQHLAPRRPGMAGAQLTASPIHVLPG